MIFSFGRNKKQKTTTVKPKKSLLSGITELFSRTKQLDSTVLAELKKILIMSDMGSQITNEVLTQLQHQVESKKIANAVEIKEELFNILEAMLAASNPQPIETSGLTSILMIGINGAGKTTTCGKLAAKFSADGKKVFLAAADTFRAAAIEQLQAWGERTNCTVISQQQGSDSASVVFDALSSATAKHADILLADTAGRLQTQENLMNELKKIKKVMKKITADAPTATWLVMDASLGQNNIQQAEKFHASINLTGIIITKLDGSGKAGSIFTIARQLQLPIYYIGVGESVADLEEFDSKKFTRALLDM